MFGPLSGKQQREWAKHFAKEQRESAKTEAEESRKQELHEIKLQEAAAKANQGIAHKEDVHGAKMKELGAPLGKKQKINREKLGLPSTNPLANTGVFNRGQHALPYKQGTDTVPAMLTPGEAVIPAPAAQDPKNKAAIKRMVNEGRQANKRHYMQGTYGVPATSAVVGTPDYNKGKSDVPAYSDGTASVKPRKAINSNLVIPPIPGINRKGFFWGATDVADERQGISQQTQPQPVPLIELSSAMPQEDNQFTGELPQGYSDFKMPEVNKGVQVAEARPVPILNPFDPTRYPTGVVKTDSPVPSVSLGLADTGQKKEVTPAVQPVVVDQNPVPPTEPELPKVFTDSSKSEDAWVRSKESGGRTDAKNPNSSASGLYQMTDNAWVDAIKQNPDLARMDRTQAHVQQAGRDAYKAVLSKQLDQLGISPTDETIRKAWVVGAKGYSNILNADPNAPLAIADSTKAINPNLQGKTNAEFIADANPYSIKGKDYKPESRVNIPVDPNSAEQQRLAKAYTAFKENKVPPVVGSVSDLTARIGEQKLSNWTQEKQDILKDFEKDAPVITEHNKNQVKDFWEKAFGQVYGKSGLFNEKELTRFIVTAAASKAMGYNTIQSVRFAGRDALQAADKRHATEDALEAKREDRKTALAVEQAKYDRTSLDTANNAYHTALGGNINPSVKVEGMKAWSNAKTVSEKNRVIEFLRANTLHKDPNESAYPGKSEVGYLNGKPVTYRNFQGNNQIVDPESGQWRNATKDEMIISDTAYRQNKSDMSKAAEDRLTDVFLKANKGNKEYTAGHASAEAKRHAQSFALLHDDLLAITGKPTSATDFGRMSEMATRAAMDQAKASGGALTEEGLRKAFFGQAVIDTRVGQNSKYYMTDDKKNPVPSATYQVALGDFIEKQRKEKGLDAGQSTAALEKAWEKLSPEKKKEWTDKSKGAPGSTPMLYWLYKGAQ